MKASPWRITANARDESKTMVVLENKSLTSFSLKLPPNITSLSLSNNPIASFSGMPALSELRTLYLDNTSINSFVGIPPLPKLEVISLNRTPLSTLPYFRLMIGISIDNRLSVVNGVPFSPKEKEFIEKYREGLYDLIQDGWIIVSLEPLKLLHTESRRRKVFHVSNGKMIEAMDTNEGEQRESPRISPKNSPRLYSKSSPRASPKSSPRASPELYGEEEDDDYMYNRGTTKSKLDVDLSDSDSA